MTDGNMFHMRLLGQMVQSTFQNEIDQMERYQNKSPDEQKNKKMSRMNKRTYKLSSLPGLMAVMVVCVYLVLNVCD